MVEAARALHGDGAIVTRHLPGGADWANMQVQTVGGTAMFEARRVESGSKPGFYAELAGQLESLLADEPDAIANAANTAALLFEMMPDLNWAGFYFLGKDKSGGGEELILGPFQGKAACVRIAIGRGVCGTAVARRATMRIEDVHEFADHIACDSASRSELVVPLMKDNRVLGVLDLDSPLLARFDAEDQAGVEQLAAIYLAASRFT
jgi:GAF domain-containing protein